MRIKTMLRLALLTLFTIVGSLLIMSATNEAAAAEPENQLLMDISSGGTVVIDLLPDLAPKHVERIKTLTREGFYDGIIFHRVIDGFMAQTGDPSGTGRGGSELPDLPAEFSEHEYVRGTLGMARSASPDSANSQFFICFDDCGFLNGQYTVFGQVSEGMDHVDAIAKGEPPAEPDKIITMVVAADADAQGANDADDANEADAPAEAAAAE